MDLKTRVISIQILNSDPKVHRAIEDVVNTCFTVRNCGTCLNAEWNDAKTAVMCMKFKAEPPLWCVAGGCNEHDYLPF